MFNIDLKKMSKQKFRSNQKKENIESDKFF